MPLDLSQPTPKKLKRDKSAAWRTLSAKERQFCLSYFKHADKAQAIRDGQYECNDDNLVNRANDLLARQPVREYLKLLEYESQSASIATHNYKIHVLVETVEQLRTFIANKLKDGKLSAHLVDSLVKTIAEINKMQGDYAPTKSIVDTLAPLSFNVIVDGERKL